MTAADEPAWREPPVAAARGARVVAGLDLGSDLQPPAHPLAPPAWSALLATVRAQRLEGLLAVATHRSWWPATPEQQAEAADAHRAAMALALTLERRLLALAELFDERALRWRVLKGPAVAHLDHPDPALRSFGDLDLLVAGDDLAAAMALLTGLGGTRRYAPPSPAFDRRFGKGSAWRLPDGAEVDLHRTLALGPFGLALDPEDLLRPPPDTFVVAGRPLPALTRSDRFLHACYHAALGQDPPRLSAVRDVAVLLPDEADARRALARARTWRGEAVVARALVLATDLLGWRRPDDPLLGWAAELRPTARDRRWLAAHAGPRRSSRARTVLAVEGLTGLRDRVAYARSLWPGRRPTPPAPATRPTSEP